MNSLLIYLLKVSAGTTLLYFCYLLFFRKDTFYLRNRILLILILLLPAIFPALKIPVSVSEIAPSVSAGTMENFVFLEASTGTTISSSADSFDYNKLIVLIYCTVTILFLLKLLVSLTSTFSIITKGKVQSSQFPRVIISYNKVPPFSFFPYAVIPAEEYKRGNYQDLLDHEFAHIRQGHTFDLILSELFIAIEWFNPFMWLIRRSIVLNHEYLADKVTLINNKSIRDYQYRLLGVQKGLKNISLAHSFNSLIKNRIVMINKKPTRKKAMLKNMLILPIVAVLVYAFATPEYHYMASDSAPLTIYQASEIIQKEVKGIVLNEDGKPLEGVMIMSTGTAGNASGATTGSDGRFSISSVQPDASLIFICKGYKGLTLKPDFSKEMNVKMEKDPDYKASEAEQNQVPQTPQRPKPLVVIDGVPSEKSVAEAVKELGYNMGISKMIVGKDASDKYGEKGANGVYEITTRKKAIEMGLKPPFPRLSPEDFPTFQNQRHTSFSNWVADNAKYPDEAREKKIEGWVSVNYKIELDGTLSNVVSSSGAVDPVLVNEIIRVVQSSPKWDSPKNTNVDEPLTSGITVRFKLPDQILNEAPYVVVQEMPMYPGGDAELLKFIGDNTKYPETARAEKIEGRVIIRFIINTEGNAEGASILKGVHPLLDAEALRVVSMLKGFKPGMQDGKPVNVWYMVPITFSISINELIPLKTKENEILKFFGINSGYPQEAKSASDTGRVYVVVKLEKGGVIKECKAFTEKTGIKVPFLPDVVIVGYKPSSSVPKGVKTSGNSLVAFQNEGVRVANLLTVTEIPEWKDKDIEFALTMIFTLK